MNIQIQGTNVDLTDNIRDYVTKKVETLEKVLNHYPNEEILVEVEVEKVVPDQRSGDVYRAEVNVAVPGSLFRAEEQGSDLYAAIDLVRDKLFRELRSDKNKKTTLFRKAGKRIKKLLRRGGL